MWCGGTHLVSSIPPPFGFALFYLRSVAPKEVTTSDIYWGAVPFVLIQVIMVGLIIAFPDIVSIAEKTDMKEQIELKIDIPTPDQGSETPQLNFSTEGENKGDSAPQLNFSTDTEEKK